MPTVSGLEAEFAGRVTVVRLNADEENNSRLQAEYAVRGHPSFAVLDGNNNVTDRFFGPQEEYTLRAAMTAVSSE